MKTRFRLLVVFTWVAIVLIVVVVGLLASCAPAPGTVTDSNSVNVTAVSEVSVNSLGYGLYRVLDTQYSKVCYGSNDKLECFDLNTD
jgi:hypothetical protein